MAKGVVKKAAAKKKVVSKPKTVQAAPGMDKKWMAQDDARTLMMSSVIMKDTRRLKAATAEAKRMAAEKKKEADAMCAVASKSTPKKER